ncbi:serine/threonine-protein kinase [Streptomyces sp. NPDC052015]|uniref:serine/threonine-protein kinase n=1 Tax=Streptomyces sp. NPDC052015 TaxID=3154755 RepID=UPI00343051E8
MNEGHLLGGRYRLRGRIGSGGMGEVWQGHDTTLDRRVAVKMLPLDRIALGESDDERRERIRLFEREARTMARIVNAHVAIVHDQGREGDVLYLVMEYIDGVSLAGWIGEGAQLTLEQVVRWTVHICQGLAAAHAEGVIHRDIKPANIMITHAGDAKVVDFGIACFQDATRSRSGHATPLYTAPERFARDGDENPGVDLYSLGCVMYEMLTGKPPFGTARSSVPFLISEHLHRPPPAPGDVRRGVPPELDRLVVRLLDKDPAGRPAGADEVEKTIQQVVVHDPRVAAWPAVASGTGGRPHVNTGYVEEIRRNERRIRELTDQGDRMADAVLDARARQAELTGLSGDARGAAALYQRLGDDCAAELGWQHRRVRDAYVAVARWTDMVDDPDTT